MDIWNIVWPFGTVCVHLVHFSCFGVMHQEKSGNPERKYKKPRTELSQTRVLADRGIREHTAGDLTNEKYKTAYKQFYHCKRC
jgi:hypothetical protein